MDGQPSSPTPFQMFLVQPQSSNVGVSSVPAAQPGHIQTVEFLANDAGEKVTATVPAVGSSHEYTYTIFGGIEAAFHFEHSGRFNLTPTYTEAPPVQSANGDDEGSARAHGESGNQDTDVIHPIGAKRTVTWQIQYLGSGDPYEPYTIIIGRT